MADTRSNGLPSVPRGLDQALTVYLQALDGIVRRMAGMVRGSAANATATGATSTAGTAANAAALASAATATSAAATAARNGNGDAPTATVGASQIADGAVGEKQLRRGVLTGWREGTARDGEDVDLGAWAGRPALCVTGFDMPASGAGRLCVGLENLRHDGKVWRCTARASGNGGTGVVRWAVIGKKA